MENSRKCLIAVVAELTVFTVEPLTLSSCIITGILFLILKYITFNVITYNVYIQFFKARHGVRSFKINKNQCTVTKLLNCDREFQEKSDTHS